MNEEQEILKVLKRQQKLLEGLSEDFRLLCNQLGILAEQLNDPAEDEPSELPFPEQIKFPQMGGNS